MLIPYLVEQGPYVIKTDLPMLQVLIFHLYLPAGEWVDFWTGERLEGGRWLKQVKMPLERMPIYVKYGAKVPIYPHPVQCTDEMDMAKTVTLTFDDSYQGMSSSVLGDVVGL